MPTSLSGTRVLTRLTRPHPSSLFGIFLTPISSAPKINSALIKAACGAGRAATSIRYSLTSTAAPAAAGVAIDVPLYSRYQLLLQEPEALLAS